MLPLAKVKSLQFRSDIPLEMVIIIGVLVIFFIICWKMYKIEKKTMARLGRMGLGSDDYPRLYNESLENEIDLNTGRWK